MLICIFMFTNNTKSNALNKNIKTRTALNVNWYSRTYPSKLMTFYEVKLRMSTFK